MEKRPIPPIADPIARLRLLTEADLAVTLRWRNQAHIRRWFFHSEILPMSSHRRWFEGYCQRDDDYVFIIEEVAAGCRPVGQAAIYQIDWKEKRAEYGRLMIGEASATGKGLATAATRLALQIAFGELGLRQVYLDVFSNNTGALAVYRRVGFQEYGSDDRVTRMVIEHQPPFSASVNR